MKIVADAGPLIAAVDADEVRHGVSRRILEHFGSRVLVPDVIVAEVDYILRTKASDAAARAFLSDVAAGALTRVALDGRAFARAVEYEHRFPGLKLGIADASVMALAETENAKVLTFDFRDFRATRPLRGGHWRLLVDEEGLRRMT